MSVSGTRLIEVRNLVKHFPIGGGVLRRRVGAVKAVDDVSFDVMSGETLGLVGEHGCGKTTTARLIARLLDPTSGEIRVQGRDIAGCQGAELQQLRREVQMIYSDPDSSLNPHRQAGAIIGEAYSIHGIHPVAGERTRQAQELMRRVGLDPEHHNRYPHEFSGGDRQRIAIARAIALEPKALVADEPVAALDVSIQTQILSLLRELQREQGLTLILMTRDLPMASYVCDRVAVMYLGKIVEMAPNESLFGFPRHPYTGALLAAVPGAHRDRKLLTGEIPSPAAVPSGCRFHPRCPKAAHLCAEHDPPLADKGGGAMAACHYPLTREEADSRLPAGLGAVDGTP